MHQGDLPQEVVLNGDLAIDTEAMGLSLNRDRLCLLQISDGNGDAHLIQFSKDQYDCPNLKQVLTDRNRIKIFHFARFDVAIIQRYLNIDIENIFCTKIASKLCRTYTDSHSLKELCKELLGVSISKQQQTSDWGAEILSLEQLEYAASDVLYLHQLRNRLLLMLKRETRVELALEVFKFIPVRAKLDWLGWQEVDIFAH